MEWLDRPLGPLRVRAWGLLLNMLANAVALFGLAFPDGFAPERSIRLPEHHGS